MSLSFWGPFRFSKERLILRDLYSLPVIIQVYLDKWSLLSIWIYPDISHQRPPLKFLCWVSKTMIYPHDVIIMIMYHIVSYYYYFWQKIFWSCHNHGLPLNALLHEIDRSMPFMILFSHHDHLKFVNVDIWLMAPYTHIYKFACCVCGVVVRTLVTQCAGPGFDSS